MGFYAKKRNNYAIRKYSTIVLNVVGAAAIITGSIMKDISLIGISGSLEFPLLFYTYDVILERREIKRKEKADITKFLENQRLFE
jgi:hypothetical protein